MSSRRRPLRTCGVSILATAQRAYTLAQEFNGPLGSVLLKRLAQFANRVSPLTYAMVFPYLAVLSLMDDGILMAESLIEKAFPRSSYIFDKIDKLVLVAEALPGKVDNFVNKVPTFIHQFPFLDRLLLHVLSWLMLWVSILTHWESRKTTEKEIMVDTNCRECCNRSACIVDTITSCCPESQTKLDSENTGKITSGSEVVPEIAPSETESESTSMMADAGVEKGTYKEVLEKAIKEEVEESSEDKNRRIDFKIEDDGQAGEKASYDPILDLFESAWLKKPGKPGRRGKKNTMARSVSYS